MIHHSMRTELDSHLKTALVNAGLFYSQEYSTYLSSLGNSPVYLYDSDFILLVVLKKKSIFRFADLPVEYFQYTDKEKADVRGFLDQCFQYLKDSLKLHWVNQPYTSARFRETPTDCIRIPYGNHIIDLKQDEEEIWNSFNATNRNRIRKAEKSGVEIRFGGLELLDDFYRLNVETSTRSCIAPLDKAFFEEPFKYFPDYIQVNVAYFNGKPQGASYCYADGQACYDMYAGSASPSETGSGNLLVWRTVQRMKEKNLRVYSLVGARINPDPESKYHGINKFKSKFAPCIEPCFLFKAIFDIRRYKAYMFLKKARMVLTKNGNTEDIIDQEISKWISMNEAEALIAVYGDEIMKAEIDNPAEVTLS